MYAEFATIVGLICAFSSGRGQSKIADVAEFQNWLAQHNHGEILDKINSNSAILIGIKAILNLNHNELTDKLDCLSKQVASLSINYDGFNQIAESCVGEILSKQALEIISEMYKYKSEYLLITNTIGERGSLLLSSGPGYKCAEPQFMQDDLDTMLSLGILRLGYNSRGHPMYYFTRIGARVVEKLDNAI
jgi:hypothetical protein